MHNFGSAESLILVPFFGVGVAVHAAGGTYEEVGVGEVHFHPNESYRLPERHHLQRISE